ncbi:MAG: CHASE domain-containing protein, partial [Pseudolabrys sp.]|nr:CHASE domain-containing protein [Pseudolabrys sp.]
MTSRPRFRLHYPALVIGLGVSIIVSAVVASWVDTHNREIKAARVDNLTQRVATEVALRFKHYEFGLRGARGAVITAGGERVTREKFRQYSATRDIDIEFPGAHGFGFVRPVKPEAKAAFVDLARLDGEPDFKIKQLSPHPGELFVIQYIEPTEGNQQAIGLDIASEAKRRAAAIASQESGKATLTEPITLVQASGKRGQGFLLLLPVFRADWPIATVDQRKTALIGWTYTVLVIDEVLAGSDMTGVEFGYSLADSKSNGAAPFYSIARSQAPVSAGTSRRVSLDLYGRTWQIDIWALPPFIEGLNLTNPWAVFFEALFAGLLLTALMVLYLSNQARRHEQSIERSRLAAIVDGSNDAIIGKALDGTITDWNPAAERLFGYSANQAIGRNATDLIVPPDLMAEEQDALARIRDGLSVPHFRTRRTALNGKPVDMLVNMSPIKTDQGKLIGAATTAQDITNLVAYEDQIRNLNASLEKQVAERTAQLLASSALQSAILQQAAYAVIATDTAGTITLFNPAAEKMLGYQADEMVGHKSPGLFHDPKEVEEKTAELSIQCGRPIEPGFEMFAVRAQVNKPDINTWSYIAKDGRRIPVRISLSQLLAADDSEIGYLGIAIDLTEQLKREAELEDAKRDAERAGAAKADFLANMSHEIRTPLNGIIGYADLALEDNAVSPATRRHISRVFEASNALRVIIDDILDFSKIEARGVELEPKPFYPGELTDNCTSIVKPKANE